MGGETRDGRRGQYDNNAYMYTYMKLSKNRFLKRRIFFLMQDDYVSNNGGYTMASPFP